MAVSGQYADTQRFRFDLLASFDRDQLHDVLSYIVANDPDVFDAATASLLRLAG